MARVPRLYTLEEAQTELEKRKCQTQGHDLTTIFAVGSADPVALTCVRCGRKWVVEEGIHGE